MQNAWLKKKNEDEADKSIDKERKDHEQESRTLLGDVNDAKEEYVAELLAWISETLPDHPTEQILGIVEYEFQRSDCDWDIEEILDLLRSRLPGNHEHPYNGPNQIDLSWHRSCDENESSILAGGTVDSVSRGPNC